MTISADERQRLTAILGMLGSEHQGERDAAALQAEAFRRKHGLTWAELIEGKTVYLGGAPPWHTATPPSPEPERPQRTTPPEPPSSPRPPARPAKATRGAAFSVAWREVFSVALMGLAIGGILILFQHLLVTPVSPTKVEVSAPHTEWVCPYEARRCPPGTGELGYAPAR
jgi:hypothetical protein